MQYHEIPNPVNESVRSVKLPIRDLPFIFLMAPGAEPVNERCQAVPPQHVI